MLGETPEGQLIPVALPPLNGDEQFTGTDATVLDFWRFAMSDLRMNNARGYLAEFLVHLALGVNARRVEWDNVDVLWNETRIEVKSSAYLQAWNQRALSRITFTGLRAHSWDEDTGYSAQRTYKADVYVFAVQTTTDPTKYDPLDLAAWDFYVLPRTILVELEINSIGLRSVQRYSRANRLSELREAISRAVTGTP